MALVDDHGYSATASPLQSKLHCVCTHFAGLVYALLAEYRSLMSRIARSEVPDSSHDNSGTCGRPQLLTATTSPLQTKLHCVCTHFAGLVYEPLALSRSLMLQTARIEVTDSSDGNSGTCGRPRLLTATASPLQTKLRTAYICTHFAWLLSAPLAEPRAHLSRIACTTYGLNPVHKLHFFIALM